MAWNFIPISSGATSGVLRGSLGLVASSTIEGGDPQNAFGAKDIRIKDADLCLFVGFGPGPWWSD
jgi:hypothetical protein